LLVTIPGSAIATKGVAKCDIGIPVLSVVEDKVEVGAPFNGAFRTRAIRSLSFKKNAGSYATI
jgi:hypothetical protein